MIEVVRDPVGDIEAILIDGESLDFDGIDAWILPKGLAGDNLLSDLPDGAHFDVCKRIEAGVIVLDSIPIRFQKVGPDCLAVTFDDSGTRKYWDGKIGFKPYMEAKKAVVEERSAEIGDLSLVNYEDDGAWIRLEYATTVTADKLRTAIDLAEQVVAEIDGAAEMRLGCELWAPTEAGNEKEFTLGTVLPILRKLGFLNVRYSHGKREFGKDVLFARITELHEIEHWAAQIKFGNIGGGAGAEVDTLLGQIDDAFGMPFHDLYSKQKQHISKLAIITSGRFTDNAIEKICEKIQSHAVRNNVVFIDGEKLKTLAERFRGKG